MGIRSIQIYWLFFCFEQHCFITDDMNFIHVKNQIPFYNMIL